MNIQVLRMEIFADEILKYKPTYVFHYMFHKKLGEGNENEKRKTRRRKEEEKKEGEKTSMRTSYTPLASAQRSLASARHLYR